MPPIRLRNHTYSKKEIDTWYHGVLFDKCSVVLTKPPADIMDIKSKQKLKLAVVNVDQSKTIGKTKKKQTIVTNQPSNKSFSSPLQEKTYASSTSEVIPTNKWFVATPTDSHGPLAQVTAPLLVTATLMPTATTFVASQPPMQNTKSVANSRLHRAEDSTNVLGIKHQLVNVPTSQIKVEVSGNNPQPRPTVLNAVEPKVVSFLKCDARNCTNLGKFLCIHCKAVQYCSFRCQGSDCLDRHKNICQQLQNM